MQAIFYLMILGLLVSTSVSATLSHDENQFIAPGQLLLSHGWVPYFSYPYTHMPYSTIFYAISAGLSDYDFLAGRVLSSVAWLACIMLTVAIARRVRTGVDDRSWRDASWPRLGWEFLLVYLFIHHAPALFILRTALNHSWATLLTLLSTWFFVSGITSGKKPSWWASLSGACMAAAAMTRLNFASLVVVLLVCWMLYALWLKRGSVGRLLLSYAGGALASSLPVLALAAIAPRQFFYTNAVYVRLNTIYYEQLLHKSGMELASKLRVFKNGILVRPLDQVLYAVLIFAAVYSIVQLVRTKSVRGLALFSMASVAGTLWLTAFAPTPTLLHYFAAAVPFLFLVLMSIEFGLGRLEVPARSMGALLVVLAAAASIRFRSPLAELAVLRDPAAWPPVQVHELSMQVRNHVPDGKILTLQPMIALEAGDDVYPFTVNGPFSWRTSLLLTAERRRDYDVTSPEELPAVLAASPPDAILEGFEAPNAGFERQQLGGLETPFAEYARAHGYNAVVLIPPYWPRGLTLWIRP